jgi:hypothetical protein
MHRRHALLTGRLKEETIAKLIGLTARMGLVCSTMGLKGALTSTRIFNHRTTSFKRSFLRISLTLWSENRIESIRLFKVTQLALKQKMVRQGSQKFQFRTMLTISRHRSSKNRPPRTNSKFKSASRHYNLLRNENLVISAVTGSLTNESLIDMQFNI